MSKNNMEQKNSIVKKTIGMTLLFLSPLSFQKGESFLSHLFKSSKKKSSHSKKSKRFSRKKRFLKRKTKSFRFSKKRNKYPTNNVPTTVKSQDIALSTPLSSPSINTGEKVQKLTTEVQKLTIEVQKLTTDLQTSLSSHEKLEEKMNNLIKENFIKEKNSINNIVDEKIEELKKSNVENMKIFENNLCGQLDKDLKIFYQKLNFHSEEINQIKQYINNIERKFSIPKESSEFFHDQHDSEEEFNSQHEDLQSINSKEERRDDSMVENDAQVEIENRDEENENIQAQILNEEIRQREENNSEQERRDDSMVENDAQVEMNRDEENKNIQAQILNEEIRQREENGVEEQLVKEEVNEEVNLQNREENGVEEQLVKEEVNEEVNLQNREEKEEEKKKDKPKRRRKRKNK